MGFAPTWLRQLSLPLLHKTTLTTGYTVVTERRERQRGCRGRERDGGREEEREVTQVRERYNKGEHNIQLLGRRLANIEYLCSRCV